jgi:hypothetical protein
MQNLRNLLARWEDKASIDFLDVETGSDGAAMIAAKCYRAVDARDLETFVEMVRTGREECVAVADARSNRTIVHFGACIVEENADSSHREIGYLPEHQ